MSLRYIHIVYTYANVEKIWDGLDMRLPLYSTDMQLIVSLQFLSSAAHNGEWHQSGRTASGPGHHPLLQGQEERVRVPDREARRGLGDVHDCRVQYNPRGCGRHQRAAQGWRSNIVSGRHQDSRICCGEGMKVLNIFFL